MHISFSGYKDIIVDAELLYTWKRIDIIEYSFEVDEVVVLENYGNSDVLKQINSCKSEIEKRVA